MGSGSSGQPAQLRLSMLAVAAPPPAVHLARILQRHRTALDDALIARVRAYAADVSRCSRSVATHHAAEDDLRPPAAKGTPACPCRRFFLLVLLLVAATLLAFTARSLPPNPLDPLH